MKFGAVVALNRLNAGVDAPVTSLIGPNGAGKTTLLNVISGFLTPSGGGVTLDGVDLSSRSPRARVFAGLRRSFQQELIAEDLTLEENIAAVADNLCGSRSDARKDVRAAMEFTGLTRQASVRGGKLDYFSRRMTEIAKTLIGSPKLILFDEPGAGLSELEAIKLREIIAAIPTQIGARVLLIDHDADLIAAICNETLVLDFGSMIAFGNTANVLRDPVVLKAYLGEAQAS